MQAAALAAPKAAGLDPAEAAKAALLTFSATLAPKVIDAATRGDLDALQTADAAGEDVMGLDVQARASGRPRLL
jgi:hypothetical protein